MSLLNAVLILVCLLVLLALASAKPSAPHRSIYRFKLGDANCTIVSDGPLLFAENPFLVPDPAVKDSYAKSGRFIDPIRLAQNVVIIDLPRVGRVMIDTGSRGDEPSSTSPDSGKLFDHMKIAGIAPESIDVVLLTHGHLDHTAGLRTPGGGSAFPNSRVYISRKEHRFWTSPHTNPNTTDASAEAIQFFAFKYITAVESYKDRLFLIPKTASKILPGIRFISGPGHTPGSSAVVVTSRGKRLIVAGDTWVTKDDQLRHPDWGFSYETDRAQAYKSRIYLLSLAARRNDLVLAYHETFPGLGYVKKSNCAGAYFDWVPVLE